MSNAPKPFTITSFAWDKDIERRLAEGGHEPEPDEVILRRLSALATFLEREQLTTRRLVDANGRVSEDFALRSDDLTALGLQLIRKAYEKWHRQAKTPEDVRPLESALAQIRTGKAEDRKETSPTRARNRRSRP